MDVELPQIPAVDLSRGSEGLAVTRGRSSTADSGTSHGRDTLAWELADLARTLQSSASPQEVLDHAVTLAVALVPGASAGAISLVRHRRTVTSAAATTPAARHLDDLQTELGQGPCLDAVFTHRSTRVDDLARESGRWPALAARAAEIGMPSMLCLQLFVQGDNLGALNLLGGRPAAFTDASEHVGLLLAAHIAVAVADARRLEHTSGAWSTATSSVRPKASSWSGTNSAPMRPSRCCPSSARTSTASCTTSLRTWPPPGNSLPAHAAPLAVAPRGRPRLPSTGTGEGGPPMKEGHR